MSTDYNTIEQRTRNRDQAGILDLSKLDAAEVIDPLNTLIANYSVHYQKLRNFHWNVTGGDFFDLHEKFEEQYNFIKVAIDVLAERIRVFGQTPLSTMKDYLQVSEINETSTDLAPLEMVSEVLRDYETMVKHTTNAIEVTQKIGDYATEDALKGYLSTIEKNHWMFTAFVTGK